MFPFSSNKKANTRIDESEADDSTSDNEGIDYSELYNSFSEIYNNSSSNNNILDSWYSPPSVNETQYKYTAIETLQEDIEKLVLDREFTVHICAYQVNTSGLLPFLQFFMHKPDTDIIQFPMFQYKIGGSDFMLKCLLTLDLIFFSFKKDEPEYIFHGYKMKNGDSKNLYLFFDCTSYAIDSHKLDRMNDVWLALPDELINQKRVCNFQVDSSVIDFFTTFPEFLLLQDSLGENIESPTVAYLGGHDKRVDFYSVFGSPKLLENGYFTFTTYKNAVKGITYKDGEKVTTRVGIVRFAIFLGSMKLLAEDDEILIKDEYDSVYQHKGGNSYWYTKTYEQQSILSHHFINKATVGENEDGYIY